MVLGERLCPSLLPLKVNSIDLVDNACRAPDTGIERILRRSVLPVGQTIGGGKDRK